MVGRCACGAKEPEAVEAAVEKAEGAVEAVVEKAEDAIKTAASEFEAASESGFFESRECFLFFSFFLICFM